MHVTAARATNLVLLTLALMHGQEAAAEVAPAAGRMEMRALRRWASVGSAPRVPSASSRSLEPSKPTDRTTFAVAPNYPSRCEHVPRDIYMLWASGWDTAGEWERLVLWTWKYFNPNYTVHELDMEEAQRLAFRGERSRWIDDDIWENLAIQAQSDILRVHILARYGGVWVDASLACNAPLDASILAPDGYMQGNRDVVMFRRDDSPRCGIACQENAFRVEGAPHAPQGNAKTGKTARTKWQDVRHATYAKTIAGGPHLATWFMVARGPGRDNGGGSEHTCSNYALTTLRDEFRRYWSKYKQNGGVEKLRVVQKLRLAAGLPNSWKPWKKTNAKITDIGLLLGKKQRPYLYLWMHKIVGHLIASNPRFAAAVDASSLPSANGPYCTMEYVPKSMFPDGPESMLPKQPMFKRCNQEWVMQRAYAHGFPADGE